MRGRVGREIGGGERRLPNRLPRGGRFRRHIALDRDPRRDPNTQRIVRLIEFDPGHPVAEEIVPFAPFDRRGLDVERRGMNALS